MSESTFINLEPLDQDDACCKCEVETPAVAVINGGINCAYCGNGIPLCQHHLMELAAEISPISSSHDDEAFETYWNYHHANKAGHFKTFAREFYKLRKRHDDIVGTLTVDVVSPDGSVEVISTEPATWSMTPPWVKFPHYEPGSMGFRMGTAEDYYGRWRGYWNGLDERNKLEVRLTAPEDWFEYLR